MMRFKKAIYSTNRIVLLGVLAFSTFLNGCSESDDNQGASPSWTAKGEMAETQTTKAPVSRDFMTPSQVAEEGFSPKWSPSGDLILFYVGDYWSGSEVRIVNREGTTIHQIPQACYPAWLGSDDRICYVSRKETGSQLYVYELRSKKSSPVYESEGRAILYPSASPDGQHVAFFLEDRSKHSDVALLSLKNGKMKTFLGEKADSIGMAPVKWSHDGSRLIFCVHGPPYLSMIDVGDGSMLVLIAGPWAKIFEAAEWRPGAEGLLLAGPFKPKRLYFLPKPEQSVYELAADHLKFPVLLGEGSLPCWSPDGQRFAFYREGAIYVASLPEFEPSAPGRLNRGMLPYFEPESLLKPQRLVECTVQPSFYDKEFLDWSPDGSLLVYAAQRGIFVVGVP